MQNWLSNPYFNLTAIRNKDMFFGRGNLLRRFYAAIVNHQSVSLVGSRHIGKSSFLSHACLPEIQARFPELNLCRHIFVYLDLGEFLRMTREDFFHTVSSAIITRSQTLSNLRIHLRLEEEGKAENEFSLLLQHIRDQDYFPVLLLDGFDNITSNEQFDLKFFRFLRAQATMDRVSYVTATLAPLAKIAHKGIVDSPFFNIFYNYPLGLLTLEESRALIEVPLKNAGLSCSEEDIAWVLRLAGGHPFFIQRVCYHLYEEKASKNSNHIDLNHIEMLVYEDLLPHFQNTWERLSEEHLAILQNEARQKEKNNRALPELSESALFRLFVCNTCQVEVFEMTPEELEKALEKIDDAAALGETNLQLMNLVSQRLKKETPPSITEKGMVIRDILNQALERLRGSQIKSDNDRTWQDYNILHYRYFKYHMKNEHIAARLSISVRQYFRYRAKAIEALLNALLEMEKASLLDAQITG